MMKLGGWLEKGPIQSRAINVMNQKDTRPASSATPQRRTRRESIQLQVTTQYGETDLVISIAHKTLGSIGGSQNQIKETRAWKFKNSNALRDHA